jgi:surfeit locus 1 family protein
VIGRRSVISAAVATLLGAALLCGLGVWQLQRLAWKEGLIAEVTERVHAPPVDAPEPSAWAALRAADYEYRHVRLHGAYDYSHQALVFRSLGDPHARLGGPGFLVMTPLKLPSGESVIVNRGFVPEELEADASNGPKGVTDVTGLMRSTEDRTWFTPADNPAKGEWFTRDIEKLALAMGLGPHAPFSIDADAGADPASLPEGGETVLAFPNNHLSYAFTWFGMALALVGVFFAWVFTRGWLPAPGSLKDTVAILGDLPKPPEVETHDAIDMPERDKD